MTYKRDNRGVVTSVSYDASSRVTHEWFNDGVTPDKWYTYDAAGVPNGVGHLTGVSNSYAATNYTSFDAVGNVSVSNQVTAGQTYRFGYAYNLAGQLASETYPSGRTITTGYDVANRAVSLNGSRAGASKSYVVSASYLPHGAINTLIEGNNVVPVYVYNSRLQLNQTYTTVGNSPNSYLQVINYNWGSTTNNGNLLNATVGSGASVPYASLSWFGQGYNYDGVNRLNSFLDNGDGVNNGRNFGYDQYGNMVVTGNAGFAWNGQTSTSTSQFSAANQLTTTSYDAAGNQLGIPNVCSNCLSYDADNRQTGHTASGTTYQYDALGERVAKIHGSTTTVYVYDALGQLASEYTNGITDAAPCATCYLTWDHLGTTRLVTDQNANVVSRHDYLPFGEEIPAGSIGRSTQYGALDAVEQKFTGQQRDEESQLDYFDARYYGGALGRFTSPDPGNAGADLFNPQTWNGYSYVGNNPIIYTDPSGMDFQGFVSGLGNFFTNLGSAFNTYFNPPCGSDFCSTTTQFGFVGTVGAAVPGLSDGGGGGNGGGGTGGGGASGGSGVKFVTTVSGQSPSSPPQKMGTCYSLAAGQAPGGTIGSWFSGTGTAASMTTQWVLGVGPTNSDFGPGSVQSQEMMSAYGLSGNVKAFLGGGAPSGNQTFGLSGLWSTGLNPTGQFVGSYQWSMSRSDGNLNITLTNSTTAWSAFYHPKFLNPNPPTRNGWRPMGRVNQTFHVAVPCS